MSNIETGGPVTAETLSHTSGLNDTAVMNGRHDDSALGEEIKAWKCFHRSTLLFNVPPARFPEAVLQGVRAEGELSSVPGPSPWSMPWAWDPGESARPRN
jgi:hypothetical protein